MRGLLAVRSRTERPRLEQSVSDAVVDVGRYSSRDSDGKNSFTYGNGIVHTLTQNERQLPDTSRDAYGATEFLDDQYDYDQNGNVKYPNVNALVEMTDMREAQRSYEANINVITATRRMIQRTIDILRA